MRKHRNQIYTAPIERGGRICFPRALTSWKIGERVFFKVLDGAIQITPRPTKALNGRIFSTRIARKFKCRSVLA